VTSAPPPEQVTAVVREALAETGLDVVEHRSGTFEVALPGERKLQTTLRLQIGDHTMAVHAFVARQPDENHQRVYRFLLERNLRTYAVSFAVDAAGDIYLDGRVPLHAVTTEEVDRLLGAVTTHVDETFNTILELGFETSMRREWAWRISRGESTRNLEAFRHLLERPGDAAGGAGGGNRDG
jgi:8-oxo-dGTP pyrophosphatase MutT (NUDIX family)